MLPDKKLYQNDSYEFIILLFKVQYKHILKLKMNQKTESLGEPGEKHFCRNNHSDFAQFLHDKPAEPDDDTQDPESGKSGGLNAAKRTLR